MCFLLFHFTFRLQKYKRLLYDYDLTAKWFLLHENLKVETLKLIETMGRKSSNTCSLFFSPLFFGRVEPRPNIQISKMMLQCSHYKIVSNLQNRKRKEKNPRTRDRVVPLIKNAKKKRKRYAYKSGTRMKNSEQRMEINSR